MWKTIVAISVGSAVGGVMRWGFSQRLNHLTPAVPMGTLLANVVAGYIVGLALAYFASAQTIAPEWRLLIITGFCGGLSTFSTFSAEVVVLLQQGRFSMASVAVLVHVVGSILATLAGIASFGALRS
jgi:fluoride exporter